MHPRRFCAPALAASILSAPGLIAPLGAAILVVDTPEATVTNNGNCSLPEAILASNGNSSQDQCPAGSGIVTDVITFSGGAGALITLSAPLTITEALTIVGPGTANLTISGGDSTNLFVIDAAEDDDFSLSLLTLANAFGAADGGALRIVTVDLVTVSEVDFLGNRSGANGGAIAGVNGTLHRLQVSDSAFSGNQAAGSGGAIYGPALGLAVVTIDTCLFVDNEADQGGAIDTRNDLEIVNSLFRDNEAIDGSGGAILSLGILTLDASTVVGNAATQFGGAVSVAGASVIRNSTLAGNRADLRGGALVASTQLMTVVSSTLVENRAPEGAGVGGGDAVELGHTILDNWTLGGASSNCASSTIISLGSNIESATDCGLSADPSDRQSLDPGLGILGQYGGATPTILPLIASPVIDSGDPAGCTDEDANPLTTDQRGMSRPIDGDGQGGARCDVGAVEVVAGEAPLFADGFEAGDTTAWG